LATGVFLTVLIGAAITPFRYSNSRKALRQLAEPGPTG
jgi:hypothetical protein